MKHPVDLDLYISELKKRQLKLLDQYDEITSSLEEVSEQLRAAEVLRADIEKYFGLTSRVEKRVDERLRLKFAQMSIIEMLVRLASEADGILDVTEARKTLVQAGVFKDERNAATSIAPTIGRHEDTFKRVGRGIYLLTKHRQAAPFQQKSQSPAEVTAVRWKDPGHVHDFDKTPAGFRHGAESARGVIRIASGVGRSDI